MDVFEKLKTSVIELDPEASKKAAEEALKEGIDAYDAIMNGLAEGMKEISNKYETGEAWVPDLLMAADAMNEGISILKPHIKKAKNEKQSTRIVLGTIIGDIHDIGKNLVKAVVEANGFEVFDLGNDVPPEAFIDKAKEINADIVGVSALLTTGMAKMKEVLNYAKKIGYREKVIILFGGGCVTRDWSLKEGADGYAPDALSSVREIKKLLEERGKY